MRAVVQRVNYGRVTIDGRVTAEIEKGLVILLGVGPADDEEKSTALARKIAQLRILEDDQDRLCRLLGISAGVPAHQVVPVGHISSKPLEGNSPLQGYYIFQIGTG